MEADPTPDDTSAPAEVATPFAGVDRDEWGDLVARGRDSGELHAEDVAHVLRHVPDRASLAAGLVAAAVVVLADDLHPVGAVEQLLTGLEGVVLEGVAPGPSRLDDCAPQPLAGGPHHLHAVHVVRLAMVRSLPLPVVLHGVGKGVAGPAKDRRLVHIVPKAIHP